MHPCSLQGNPYFSVMVSFPSPGAGGWCVELKMLCVSTGGATL